VIVNAPGLRLLKLAALLQPAQTAQLARRPIADQPRSQPPEAGQHSSKAGESGRLSNR
jgi:hypothetical protein